MSIADTQDVWPSFILHACVQVAKLEQELDDAYDDLEPILRGMECKDQYVSPPPSHTYTPHHVNFHMPALHMVPAAPGGINHVTFQIWRHAACNIG